MKCRALLAAALFLLQTCAVAADVATPAVARLGRVAFELPAGFTGPERAKPNEASDMDVYVSREPPAPTLLQVTRVSVPAARTDLTEEDKTYIATNFLSGFLQIFSAKTTEWSLDATEPIRLGGHVAVRARWTGKLRGLPVRGTTYFLVLGKENFCLQAFGGAMQPNAALEATFNAIQALQVSAEAPQ